MSVINDFRGQYRWLSNFHLVTVRLGDLWFKSTEHAYQAAKTKDLALRVEIQGLATCGQAKRAGQRLVLRPDWEQIKQEVMLNLQRQKYSYPELRTLLLATGDSELIEGNTWGDTYWGVCRGIGQNWLGKILMQVRAECVTPPPA